MTWLKKFLNSVTMYRLMLMFLLGLFVAGLLVSWRGLLPFRATDLFLQGLYLVLVCIVANKIFAKLFRTKPNLESRSITALILTLIITPGPLPENFVFLTLVGAVAMASKYFLAIGRRHIFNPAGFAAVFTAVFLNQGASWWVGNKYLLPFVLIGGLLMVYKIRRFHLVISFLVAYFALESTDFSKSFHVIGGTLVNSPLLFFSFVMLVEPLTSPQSKILRIWFGIIVAASFMIIQRFFPGLSFPLELSLLVGNIFSRIVNPNIRQIMRLVKKESAADNTANFWFEPEKPFQFLPGQFLEYTLAHARSDSRGVRRFFSIASSPTENNILLSTKFAPRSSSFKQALQKLGPGDEIISSNREGEFVLPQDPKAKLVFIAGGIGITPFRSMIKYVIDKKEKRDIILLYSVKQETDIAFRDILNDGKNSFGLKTVYVLTDRDGFIDETVIKKHVPDWQSRIFYASGPEPMVRAFEKMLAQMGLSKKQVRRDYFPGYTQ